MVNVETSITVDVPVRTAYNQWTQFESFPEFMEGIREVRQLNERTVRFTGEIAGKKHEWVATIVEQEPDRIVSWRSISGARNAGMVTFDERGPGKTRVTVKMEYDPADLVERAASAMGIVHQRVRGDLRRFKEYIESRDVEESARRGKIHSSIRRG